LFINALLGATLHLTLFALCFISQNRAKVTGRVVPRDLLELSIEQVPKSVALLRPMVDFTADIHNSGGEDVELTSPDLDWDSFTKTWSEAVCAVR